MRYFRFIVGWFDWHFKAALWYLGVAFRLFFAIGLDADFDPSKEDNDVMRSLKFTKPRSYRAHLRDGAGSDE